MWLSDEEYLFRQDIAEKKKTATGAYHKVKGSKSKKCNFPSDYLTKKEKLKMNSEVKSWNLNEFYTWNDFKQMPKDIQVEYLQNLTNKYKVGQSAIETSLFQIAKGTLGYHLQKHLMTDKIKWIAFRGAKAQAYNAEFERTIDKYRLAIVDTLPPVAEIEDETKTETEPEVAVEPVVEPVAEPEKPEKPKKSAKIKMEEPPVVKYVMGPEVPIIDTDIFKSSPRTCAMESDGFDLDLFKYLAGRYKNKNCIVEIRVTVKE